MFRIAFSLLPLALLISCQSKPSMPNCIHDQTCSVEEMTSYLKSVCESKADKECCHSSLNVMTEKNHSLASEGPSPCPIGQVVDQLRCADSLKWCVPQ